MSKATPDALDLELLRSFQAVARLGTLAAAAQERYRTVGAISMQLKRLEASLGTRLLERGRRGVTPTPAGAALLREARPLLQMHDAMLARFTGRGLSGTVRFGMPEDYARELISGLLPEFSANHPDVVLEAVTAPSGELARALQRGEMALAVLLDRPHQLPGGAALWQTQPVWAGPRQGDLTELSSLPMALHPADCPYRMLAIEALESLSEGPRRWHPVFTSSSIHAIESAVEAGLAVSVLDRERLTPAMRELGPADGLPRLSAGEARLHVGSRIEPGSRQAVDALAQLLIDRLRPGGPWRKPPERPDK